MPTRQVSNGNVTVWWVPTIANPAAPTPAEIAAGINLSAAISWNNFELGSSGSADTDDRSIVDVGNATGRGFPDFSATLDFFWEANNTDSTSIYRQAYQTFRTPGINGHLVVRYGQAAPTVAAAAGDYISVYKFQTDVFSTDTEGDDSVKFEVAFLPQGVLYENVLVKATTLTAAPTTITVTTSSRLGKITATLAGKDVTSSASYVSSNSAVATVSSRGIVVWQSTGTATITVSHPGATATATVTVTAS